MIDTSGIRKICKVLPGVTEDIKWGNDLVFSVGGKMFCVVGLDQSPTTASFKVSDEEFGELSERPNFRPAPYVARYKWVLAEDVSALSEKAWRHYIEQSYDLVFAKLPAKIKKQIAN